MNTRGNSFCLPYYMNVSFPTQKIPVRDVISSKRAQSAIGCHGHSTHMTSSHDFVVGHPFERQVFDIHPTPEGLPPTVLPGEGEGVKGGAWPREGEAGGRG